MNIIKRNRGHFPLLMNELFVPDWFGGVQKSSFSFPVINIKETKENYQLELAMPGIKKEDFKIELEDKLISIALENKQESQEKNENFKYTRREFVYSSFKKTFSIPDDVNAESISALYENGILNITLPKVEKEEIKEKKLINVL
jgi:HSP20 family protein